MMYDKHRLSLSKEEIICLQENHMSSARISQMKVQRPFMMNYTEILPWKCS